jgi:hypothetical protein
MSFAKSQSASQPRRSPIKFPPLHVPGQSLDENITRLSQGFDDRVLLGFIFILLTLFEWFRWWTNLQTNPRVLTLVSILILAFIAWTRTRHRREMANLKLGLDGERTVGQALEELRAHGYKVYHDILGTDFNIDHVIAGPAGIFTIETKTRSKPVGGKSKIIYDGDNLWSDNGWEMDDHLVQARAQASWLVDLLNQSRRTKYTVRPVVLFPGWWVTNVAPREKRDVWVLNEKALPYFLSYEPETLSPDDVDAAANCIEQYCRFSPIGK